MDEKDNTETNESKPFDYVASRLKQLAAEKEKKEKKPDK